MESERLLDPCNDRVVSEVPRPPQKFLSIDRVFPGDEAGNRNEAPDPELIKTYLSEGGRISKECLLELITRAKLALASEPNLLRIDGEVTIVGDIHGQFYDLIWMLQKSKARAVGQDSQQKILFLGDYVDRGLYGIEVMAYLFALKIHSPSEVFLLRGNHETREMTTFYNFRDQCLKAYDMDVYESFSEAFEALPVGAVVNRTFLSVHGGISP